MVVDHEEVEKITTHLARRLNQRVDCKALFTRKRGVRVGQGAELNSARSLHLASQPRRLLTQVLLLQGQPTVVALHLQRGARHQAGKHSGKAD